MGGKRKKVKGILSSSPNPAPPAPMAEDDTLLDDLIAQLDSKDETVQNVSAEVINDIQLSQLQENKEPRKLKKDGKVRFLERQARKAAEIAQHHLPGNPQMDAQIEKETKEEETNISRTCKLLGLELLNINPDGHCLFAAVADQLTILGIIPREQASYTVTRAAAANYIYTHPDDFLPFLPSIDGEDGIGATDAGFMTPQQFRIYCTAIRDTGVWGGEPEILALSRAYNTPIHVIQSGAPPIVVHNPTGAPDQDGGFDGSKKVVRISYHRRMYGLGEHYNSLRPKRGTLEALIG